MKRTRREGTHPGGLFFTRRPLQRLQIKDTAGKVTGDEKLESEGKFDKTRGSAHNIAGDIKDAVKQSRE
jgi:CsbD-like protein